jgi:hypothetical protein
VLFANDQWSVNSPPCSLANINNRPAVCYERNDGLYYAVLF